MIGGMEGRIGEGGCHGDNLGSRTYISWTEAYRFASGSFPAGVTSQIFNSFPPVQILSISPP